MVSLCIRKVECDQGNIRFFLPSLRKMLDLGSIADVSVVKEKVLAARQPRVCCLFRGGGDWLSSLAAELQYKLYIFADSIEISQRGPGLRTHAIKKLLSCNLQPV